MPLLIIKKCGIFRFQRFFRAPFFQVANHCWTFLFYWCIFRKFIILVWNFLMEFSKEVSVNLFLKNLLSGLFKHLDEIHVFIIGKSMNSVYDETKNRQLNVISSLDFLLRFLLFKVSIFELMFSLFMFVFLLRLRSRRSFSRKYKEITILSCVYPWHSVRDSQWICAPVATIVI